MSNLSREQKGEVLVFLSIIPYSFFPVLTKLVYDGLTPLYAAAGSTLFALIFFVVIVAIRNRFRTNWDRITWRNLLLGTTIVGVGYYGLMFWGIQYTSAGNAAIIALLEVFFNFIFFGLLRGERQSIWHMIGAGAIVIGAFLVLFPGEISLQKGDAIILLAAMITPIGNYYQQRARSQVPASFLMMIRSALGAGFLLLLAFWLEPFPGFESIQSIWGFLILNGVLALGLSKLWFLDSFAYISVSKAIALGAISPFFTLLIAYWWLGEVPSVWQLCGAIPIVLGVYFLTRKNNFIRKIDATH